MGGHEALFMQTVAVARGESVQTMIRQLAATCHEALLVKLFSDKDRFNQDAIDKKIPVIRKTVTDGKIIEWKVMCPRHGHSVIALHHHFNPTGPAHPCG